MASLLEIREKYPQYNDMPDADFAAALHRKFYSDMPREIFNSKIGLTPQPSMSLGERAVDIGKSALAGLGEAVAGIAGIPGDIQQFAKSGIEAATGMDTSRLVQPGSEASPIQMGLMPASADVRGAIEATTGPFHKPRTDRRAHV